MKKVVLAFIYTALLVLAIISATGCAKNPSAPAPAPTPTPAILYMNGGLFQIPNNGYVSLNLGLCNSSGVFTQLISGATVTMNGTALPESTTLGQYESFLPPGFADGAPLTITAVTAYGTISATGSMPVGDMVTSPANYSTTSASSPFYITWAGPNTGLQHHIYVYPSSIVSSALNVTAAATDASFNVAAGTLTTGSYFINVVDFKLLTLSSNASPDSLFYAGKSGNTFQVTLN